MTTKKKFDVEHPEVRVLKNGRYAFTAPCPWEGKSGKQLVAFKFCSAADYQTHLARDTTKSEHLAESEHKGDSDTEEP